MEVAKVVSAVAIGALALVSIELFAEALLRGASRPAMLVVLGLLAVSAGVMIWLGTRKGSSSTPYW